ncbi:hypothetical protein WOLCODRAFT_107891 [Wolfiporia cocos MD-104 SS10]|uniref:Methyltransferase domain-containing protein n=1 Tax=Wolfiporia cocos (strain MD-104) TaxID=742152 RepID=A0A2H3J1I9_WOLCO|nr:hypothetical protein WOLCODRAFT_107891 [Wolfiporia cocos MD-104 SS10]
MPPRQFIARHPRYTAVLAFVLVAFVFVIMQGAPESEGYWRREKPLKWKIMEEERRYERVLRDREDMVRKWGPTPEQVVAFPPRDDFYTLWDFFIPAFQCPHRVERVGALGDGGKWVCGLERIAAQPSCVIYSFGVNNESSFEAALLRAAPGCEVWGYDFSVPNFGPEITADPELRARAHFKPWALGAEDRYLEGVDPFPTYSLATLMALNGHTFIDVLKIDIEGAEFAALSAFFARYPSAPLVPPPPPRNDPHHPHAPPLPPPPAPVSPLPIGQMQIELHPRWGTGHDEFAPFARWWASLEGAGLRPFYAEANLVYVNLIRGARPDLAEYSFMNIHGNHALVSDHYLQ